MRFVTMFVAGALALTAPTAAADMPGADDCAGGSAAPLALGEHVGSAAVCLAAEGSTVAYVAGNAPAICGTVVLADQTLTATDPDDCDSLLDLPAPFPLEYGVLLPGEYSEHPSRRYPVLYLLTAGRGDEWSAVDPALQEIADLGTIVVLPHEGYGFYTDWVGGRHDFDDLYSRRLIADVDARYRTIPDRTQRAVAGFSKAGYGAMLLAARHPDRYAAAASFSGLLDIGRPTFPLKMAAQMAPAFARYDDPQIGLDNPIWGDPVTNEAGWHARNPTDLATNLRGLSLFESAGDAVPTPDELAADPTVIISAETELEIRLQSDNFDQALTSAGIAHEHLRRQGGHSYVSIVPQLHRWATTMMEVFAHPTPRPAAFDHRGAHPAFSAWGWDFRADPARATEFLAVTQASAAGLTLTGSGLTQVVTAPLFHPMERVGVDGQELRADQDGRLHVAVDLGPPHQDAMFTPAARAQEQTPGYVTTRTVRFIRG
jgi:S-formylglutathione hydrolase FrmB